MNKFKVIISSGENNFHLIFAAAELLKIGVLDFLIISAYPKQKIIKIIKFFMLDKFFIIKKFINRKENLSDSKIKMTIFSELFTFIFLKLLKINFLKISFINFIAFHIYSILSIPRLTNIGKDTKIFHFRCGYGQKSTGFAKKYKGLITICDCSLIHPFEINKILYSIEKNKKYLNVDIFSKALIRDMFKADFIIANSKFVKDSLIRHGVKKNIYVNYQGIEDKFLSFLPNNNFNFHKFKKSKIKFAYVGSLSIRKGLKTLEDALDKISQNNFEFHIVGDFNDLDKKNLKKLLNDKRVIYHGYQSSNFIANLLYNCQFFIFPTYAEGSARVVFEAMASSCFVVTTNNAGSIIKHLENGYIIKPGSVSDLYKSMNLCISNIQNYANLAYKGFTQIHKSYKQKNFGERMYRIYEEILRTSC